MTDTGSTAPTPLPVPARSILDSVTKFAAVLGTLVALGHAASTWIDGVYAARTEREKTDREVKLADIKERSALAESYLQLILSKDTPNDGRAILYSALGQLDGHPLQKWAQQRYELYLRYQGELSEAYNTQAEAAQQANETGGQVATIEADIQALNIQIHQAMDDPDKAAALQTQLIAKSAELGQARAKLALQSVTVAAAVATIAQSVQNAQVAQNVIAVAGTALDAAGVISALSEQVDAALLKSIFPESAWKNIDANVQFLQAAFQEFKISDPRMVAAIIATIAAEAPTFESMEQSTAEAARYENRADMGNTESGDGVKYRGRGYIMLTGRANYAKMSQLLGLGTRLVDSPEDAKSPEVASRIAVAWFADQQDRLLVRLVAGDLQGARKLLSGGLNRFEAFQSAYRAVMTKIAGVADADRYKVYLHLGQTGRLVPTRTAIEKSIGALGFAAAGDDQQLDQYGPGVDYFNDGDKEGAAAVAKALNALLGPDQPQVAARRQKAKSPDGTLGVWF